MITHADKDIDDLATASQWIPNLYDEAAIQTAKTSYIFELIRNKKPVMFMSSGAQPGCWHHLHWDEFGYCEGHRQTVLQPHHLLQNIQVRLTSDLWPFIVIPQWTLCDPCSVWLVFWPSRRSRGISGWRPCRTVSVALCPAMWWPRRSGLWRPTSAVQTVAPPIQTGPLSTSVWSFASAVQVQKNLA